MINNQGNDHEYQKALALAILKAWEIELGLGDDAENKATTEQKTNLKQIVTEISNGTN